MLRVISEDPLAVQGQRHDPRFWGGGWGGGPIGPTGIEEDHCRGSPPPPCDSADEGYVG